MSVTEVNGQLDLVIPGMSGLSYKSTRFWENENDRMFAHAGIDGTFVKWNSSLYRIEFWIYGKMVCSVSCFAPLAGVSSTTFFINNELEVKGRIFELDPSEWPTRKQSLPLEFDRLAGSWCVASYSMHRPTMQTTMWVYSNGNVRIRQLNRYGVPVFRPFYQTIDIFEGMLALGNDGQLSVVKAYETYTTHPGSLQMVTPYMEGDAYRKSSTVGEGEIEVFEAELEGFAARKTETEPGEVEVLEAFVEGFAAKRIHAFGSFPIPNVLFESVINSSSSNDGELELLQVDLEGFAHRKATIEKQLRFPNVVVDPEMKRQFVLDGGVELSNISVFGNGHAIRGFSADVFIDDIDIEAQAQRRIYVTGNLDVVGFDAEGSGNRVLKTYGDVHLPVVILDDSNMFRLVTISKVLDLPSVTTLGDGFGTKFLSGVVDVSPIEVLTQPTRVSYTQGEFLICLKGRFSGRVINDTYANYQLFRVVAITREPLGSTQTIVLESLERPLDL